MDDAIPYSRSQISKAGKALCRQNVSREKYDTAIDALNFWRSIHDEPTAHIESRLRRHIAKLKLKDTSLVRRLKRTPSIIAKLKRSNIGLERMYDVGGCRAVLHTKNEIGLLVKELENDSSIKISVIKNYIKRPQFTGYWGLHIVCECDSAKSSRPLLVEIQVREKIQHAWATAVEVAGTFLSVSLKSNEGPELWLQFFRRASVEFRRMERSLIFSALSLNRAFCKTSEPRVI